MAKRLVTDKEFEWAMEMLTFHQNEVARLRVMTRAYLYQYEAEMPEMTLEEFFDSKKTKKWKQEIV